MLCILGLAAVIVALLRRGGGGGGFSWGDPPRGPMGPAAGTQSTSIVATRCHAGASATCRQCVVHRALAGSQQRALPSGS